jgi:peptidoglycan/LPS O-acetylase OafA/YrhL
MTQLLKNERFYLLDILRGAAALSIILWHWQHFFYDGTTLNKFEVANLPLSGLLLPFYTRGWLAVDLFFCLSGFIFYWLYSERVANRSISSGRFALLRFSRLYPLHVTTLVLVAVAQLWLFHTQGSYFVYPNNDVKHFLLNLSFSSSWGLESGYSFNGPTWSVSIEVLLYALFFVLCRFLPIRAGALALFSSAGYILIDRLYSPLGRGIGSFFLGGLLFFIYRKIHQSPRRYELTKLLAAVALGAWATTFLYVHGIDAIAISQRAATSGWRFDHYLYRFLKATAKIWPALILFPATILTLALAEMHAGSLWKRMSFLGDISYSSYLLHFPLQLVVYVLFNRLGFSKSVYYSLFFMASFYAVLIFVSLCSYHYLEMPSQKFLRQYGLSPRPTNGNEVRP